MSAMSRSEKLLNALPLPISADVDEGSRDVFDGECLRFSGVASFIEDVIPAMNFDLLIPIDEENKIAGPHYVRLLSGDIPGHLLLATEKLRSCLEVLTAEVAKRCVAAYEDKMRQEEEQERTRRGVAVANALVWLRRIKKQLVPLESSAEYLSTLPGAYQVSDAARDEIDKVTDRVALLRDQVSHAIEALQEE